MDFQTIQRHLMGLSPENQEKFYKERDEFLNNTMWDAPLPDKFNHFRFFIGCHTNETVLGMTAKSYIELFFTENIEQYNIGNIANIINGSERVTFFMYHQSFGHLKDESIIKKWSYMRTEFESMTNIINGIIDPKMEEILNRLTSVQNAIFTGKDTGSYKKGKIVQI